MLEQRIQQHFIDSADLHYQVAQTLSQPIHAAVQALQACLTNGAKVMACGVGPSAALAQQFVSLFVMGFERERPELPALALSSDESELARQVRALGQMGDVLLLMTDTSPSASLLEAVAAAQERDMAVVALCGRQAMDLLLLLQETDVAICVPHDRAARVREVQALILHCLCDGIDQQLLGDQENFL